LKATTVFTFFLLFASRAANITHPLILKAIIDNISCDREADDSCPESDEVYVLIGLYALVKFGGDFLNYIREVPFAYISANAEKHIAKLVYGHIQN
jgi:hypothetical protein